MDHQEQLAKLVLRCTYAHDMTKQILEAEHKTVEGLEASLQVLCDYLHTTDKAAYDL